ncbi:MAG: Fatty acid desaturase; Delta-9 fatty acid desaturase [uncultured Solirubrobacteraceae bacterium]|uniref:Fatty acid desaturase Delta-9 fatty acid desaturase n=1 Tax=uncultured Solirubrobacteraceae bacterium TaxID=1162706 RepID=A0A6J4TDV4_9ACTN|nr:MAG: Fatty acid desaturase; Delta-9 fatty acid desaturase [uncultured Solirubrobacteraceae bacterium]
MEEARPNPGPGPGPEDIQPVANEGLDRFLTGFVTVAPIVALGFVGWQLWETALHWYDLVVFTVMYVPLTLGITVGFHRHLTHRAFKAGPRTRATLAILGSMAIEGPVIAWVADHRKHHAFADRDGDPHSPHVDVGPGWRGVLQGLWHAHVGWLFIHTQRARKERYAPDLLKDPTIAWVNRTFFWWVALGLLIPVLLGMALSGSWAGGLTGLLWGGAVRMLVLHHVTYSINSICHVFGRRRFETGDESRNVAWLSVISMGEAWHNNHHAFPTSAEHGLRRAELDPSALVIRGLERLGLAWDVVRVTPERQARKAV